MIDVNAINEILDEIKKTIYNNSTTPIHSYNIFETLGVEHNEVIICRLIGSLMLPNGNHGMQITPLKRFLEDVLKIRDESEENLHNAIIVLEEPIKCKEDADSNRRVDIVIHTNKMTYPIEVKIWAGDQPNQLFDYYNFYFKDNSNGKIYYLTPKGNKPSKSSKGNLTDEQIIQISFSEEIKNWIDVLYSECKNTEVKPIIKQFGEIIKNMNSDNKTINALKDMVSFNDQLNEDQLKRIQSLALLYMNADDLMRDIQLKYIKKYIAINEEYALLDIENKNDRPEMYPSQALMRVEKRNNPELRIWLSVDSTGLYLIVKSDNPIVAYNWHPDKDNYYWKRIEYSHNEIVDMKSFKLEKIDITKSLSEI